MAIVMTGSRSANGEEREDADEFCLREKRAEEERRDLDGSSEVTMPSAEEANIKEATTMIVMREPHDVPHPSTWPNHPILLCVNTPVSPHLQVPTFGTGPCPIGVPFPFHSELFEGHCLVRLKDVASDDVKGDEDYFRGRRRLFQMIVQGRFKEPLVVSDVLTGHEFGRPLKHLPHAWVISAGTTLIGTLAPGADIRVGTEQPSCMAILAATSQTVRVDPKGMQPDITSADIQEDCTILGGAFQNRTMTASGRKKLLSQPNRSKDYTFDTESVYTFDFYQSLLDVSTYSLDVGFAKLGLTPVLDGQPIQCLSKTRDGRYLWSFQLWHEKLLPNNIEPDAIMPPTTSS